MTLALHPTNPLTFIWGAHAGIVGPPGWRTPVVKKTCSACYYELIDGWCSRCSLEEVFDAQNPGA